jgi:hypothetical protein
MVIVYMPKSSKYNYGSYTKDRNEYMRQYLKDYYKKKEDIECCCGQMVKANYISQHRKTKKHQLQLDLKNALNNDIIIPSIE